MQVFYGRFGWSCLIEVLKKKMANLKKSEVKEKKIYWLLWHELFSTTFINVTFVFTSDSIRTERQMFYEQPRNVRKA